MTSNEHILGYGTAKTGREKDEHLDENASKTGVFEKSAFEDPQSTSTMTEQTPPPPRETSPERKEKLESVKPVTIVVKEEDIETEDIHGQPLSPKRKRTEETELLSELSPTTKDQKTVAVDENETKNNHDIQTNTNYFSHNGGYNNPPNENMNANLGRRGDPRMHKALHARLANPEMTLFEALKEGGFIFPDEAERNGRSERSIFDSDGVLLCQRKNQLSRRLRLARKSAAPNIALEAVNGNHQHIFPLNLNFSPTAMDAAALYGNIPSALDALLLQRANPASLASRGPSVNQSLIDLELNRQKQKKAQLHLQLRAALAANDGNIAENMHKKLQLQYLLSLTSHQSTAATAEQKLSSLTAPLRNQLSHRLSSSGHQSLFNQNQNRLLSEKVNHSPLHLAELIAAQEAGKKLQHQSNKNMEQHYINLIKSLQQKTKLNSILLSASKKNRITKDSSSNALKLVLQQREQLINASANAKTEKRKVSATAVLSAPEVTDSSHLLPKDDQNETTSTNSPPSSPVINKNTDANDSSETEPPTTTIPTDVLDGGNFAQGAKSTKQIKLDLAIQVYKSERAQLLQRCLLMAGFDQSELVDDDDDDDDADDSDESENGHSLLPLFEKRLIS